VVPSWFVVLTSRSTNLSPPSSRSSVTVAVEVRVSPGQT
jgi:hypothetical protein